MIIHVCLHLHWLSLVSKYIFLDSQCNSLCFELVQSISKLSEESFLTVLFHEFKISVLSRQQYSSENFKQMLEDLIFMYFHSGKDLLTHKSSLDVDGRGSSYQPW